MGIYIEIEQINEKVFILSYSAEIKNDSLIFQEIIYGFNLII